MFYFPTFKPNKSLLWPALLWGLAVLGIGIFILIDTHEFAQILAYAFGGFLIISGSISLAITWRTPAAFRAQFAPRISFWQGLFSFILGILVLALPVFFANLTWITMLYLVAVGVLVSALSNLSIALRVMRTGYPLGVSVPQFLGNGLAGLAGALLIFLAPRFIGLFLLRIVGLLLIVVGLGILVFSLILVLKH